MKNIFAVHCHHTKGHLRHVAEDVLRGKLLALGDVILYFLCETATVGVLHHDVDHVVLDKGLHELDQGGALEHAEKLDLVFRALLVFLVKKEKIDRFESVLLPIDFVSHQVHRARGTLTQGADFLELGETLHAHRRATNLSLLHVFDEGLALLDSNRLHHVVLGSHFYQKISKGAY